MDGKKCFSLELKRRVAYGVLSERTRYYSLTIPQARSSRKVAAAYANKIKIGQVVRISVHSRYLARPDNGGALKEERHDVQSPSAATAFASD